MMIVSSFVCFFSLMSLSISGSFFGRVVVQAEPQPLIFDTDLGPFIDDIFALGLLLNSDDLIDMQLILTTSEQPDLSATCVAAQLKLSGLEDGAISVAIGETLPPYEVRGSVCAIPGVLGFGIGPACLAAFNETNPVEDLLIEDGVAYAAQLILDSGRDDWWYLVVGGQTSLRRLISEFPEAASKIDTLIVMGGNWCADFEPYPGVMAPTDETNIGCDPVAANFNLDGNNIVFNNVYYVPVEMADVIGGDDYEIFVEAANSGTQPVAAATLEFYKLWSEASRADPNLLIHPEALEYDPETESTPQFDAMAVMLVLELLAGEITCGPEGRMWLYEIDAIRFYENDDEGLQPFPEAPRSAFSSRDSNFDPSILPDQCPNITAFSFDPEETPEEEYPVMIGLGYRSLEAKDAVFGDLARRLAGQITLCEEVGSVGSTPTEPSITEAPTTAGTPVGSPESTSEGTPAASPGSTPEVTPAGTTAGATKTATVALPVLASIMAWVVTWFLM